MFILIAVILIAAFVIAWINYRNGSESGDNDGTDYNNRRDDNDNDSDSDSGDSGDGGD